LAVRLLRVAHGLPEFFEEAIPLRRALRMWIGPSGHVDWNPHLFHYPSLGFYLHLFLQFVLYAAARIAGRVTSRYDYLLDFIRDPTPMALAARILHAAADAGTVLAVGLIGERLKRGAGIVAAALLALSPTLIHTSRLVYADTLMACLGAFAVGRMLAYAERGGRGRLVAAAMLVGLAGGAKYPALSLLLPLVFVVAR